MHEINDWLWETIYILKIVYDHNPEASVLRSFKERDVDGDDVYEIAESAIDQFFTDTRRDYNEEEDLSIYIFFDPLITDFWKLCAEYEERLRLKPEENKYRKEMENALDSALYIPDYSYDAKYYTDTKQEDGCRLELLCYCEFCGYHWIPEALSEAYDAFVHYTALIREELAEMKQTEIIALPKRPQQRKKAA